MTVESGTRIVITGGTDFQGITYYNDVWISDVGGVTWIELLAAAPYFQRFGFGFVNIGEKLSVFGGAGPGQTGGDRQTTCKAHHSAVVALQLRLFDNGARVAWAIADMEHNTQTIVTSCAPLSAVTAAVTVSVELVGLRQVSTHGHT